MLASPTATGIGDPVAVPATPPRIEPRRDCSIAGLQSPSCWRRGHSGQRRDEVPTPIGIWPGLPHDPVGTERRRDRYVAGLRSGGAVDRLLVNAPWLAKASFATSGLLGLAGHWLAAVLGNRAPTRARARSCSSRRRSRSA
jgi:hypothetical protein